MDLRKLPPSMVLALGLSACGDDGPQDSEAGPCLSIDPTVVSTATDTESSSGSDSGTAGTTGGSSGMGSTVGSDTGTGTGTETGSDTGGGDSTVGPCLGVEPGAHAGNDTASTSGSTMAAGAPAAPSRAEAVERVLERGTLPADVVRRLRGALDEDDLR